MIFKVKFIPTQYSISSGEVLQIQGTRYRTTDEGFIEILTHNDIEYVVASLNKSEVLYILVEEDDVSTNA